MPNENGLTRGRRHEARQRIDHGRQRRRDVGERIQRAARLFDLIGVLHPVQENLPPLTRHRLARQGHPIRRARHVRRRREQRDRILRVLDPHRRAVRRRHKVRRVRVGVQALRQRRRDLRQLIHHRAHPAKVHGLTHGHRIGRGRRAVQHHRPHLARLRRPQQRQQRPRQPHPERHRGRTPAARRDRHLPQIVQQRPAAQRHHRRRPGNRRRGGRRRGHRYGRSEGPARPIDQEQRSVLRRGGEAGHIAVGVDRLGEDPRDLSQRQDRHRAGSEVIEIPNGHRITAARRRQRPGLPAHRRPTQIDPRAPCHRPLEADRPRRTAIDPRHRKLRRKRRPRPLHHHQAVPRRHGRELDAPGGIDVGCQQAGHHRQRVQRAIRPQHRKRALRRPAHRHNLACEPEHALRRHRRDVAQLEGRPVRRRHKVLSSRGRVRVQRRGQHVGDVGQGVRRRHRVLIAEDLAQVIRQHQAPDLAGDRLARQTDGHGRSHHPDPMLVHRRSPVIQPQPPQLSQDRRAGEIDHRGGRAAGVHLERRRRRSREQELEGRRERRPLQMRDRQGRAFRVRHKRGRRSRVDHLGQPRRDVRQRVARLHQVTVQARGRTDRERYSPHLIRQRRSPEHRPRRTSQTCVHRRARSRLAIHQGHARNRRERRGPKVHQHHHRPLRIGGEGIPGRRGQGRRQGQRHVRQRLQRPVRREHAHLAQRRRPGRPNRIRQTERRARNRRDGQPDATRRRRQVSRIRVAANQLRQRGGNVRQGLAAGHRVGKGRGQAVVHADRPHLARNRRAAQHQRHRRSLHAHPMAEDARGPALRGHCDGPEVAQPRAAAQRHRAGSRGAARGQAPGNPAGRQQDPERRAKDPTGPLDDHQRARLAPGREFRRPRVRINRLGQHRRHLGDRVDHRRHPLQGLRAADHDAVGRPLHRHRPRVPRHRRPRQHHRGRRRPRHRHIRLDVEGHEEEARLTPHDLHLAAQGRGRVARGAQGGVDRSGQRCRDRGQRLARHHRVREGADAPADEQVHVPDLIGRGRALQGDRRRRTILRDAGGPADRAHRRDHTQGGRERVARQVRHQHQVALGPHRVARRSRVGVGRRCQRGRNLRQGVNGPAHHHLVDPARDRQLPDIARQRRRPQGQQGRPRRRRVNVIVADQQPIGPRSRLHIDGLDFGDGRHVEPDQGVPREDAAVRGEVPLVIDVQHIPGLDLVGEAVGGRAHQGVDRPDLPARRGAREGEGDAVDARRRGHDRLGARRARGRDGHRGREGRGVGQRDRRPARRRREAAPAGIDPIRQGGRDLGQRVGDLPAAIHGQEPVHLVDQVGGVPHVHRVRPAFGSDGGVATQGQHIHAIVPRARVQVGRACVGREDREVVVAGAELDVQGLDPEVGDPARQLPPADHHIAPHAQPGQGRIGEDPRVVRRTVAMVDVNHVHLLRLVHAQVQVHRAVVVLVAHHRLLRALGLDDRHRPDRRHLDAGGEARAGPIHQEERRAVRGGGEGRPGLVIDQTGQGLRHLRQRLASGHHVA